MGDVTYSLKRLAKLQDKCGVGKKKKNDGPEVDLAKMSAYERAQYKIATDMQRVRQNVQELDASSGASATRKAELSQSIRKDIAQMKKDVTEAQRFAKTENKRDEYEKLAGHVKKTEALWKQRYGTSAGLDDGLGGGGGGGGAPVRGVTDLEMSDLASPMVSLREDEEFAQFFEMTKKRDQEIDQQLELIGAGVQVLHDQAQRISTELKTQDVLLTQVTKKTEDMNVEVMNLNKRVKAAIKEVDKDKMCIYAVCFLLLLGLAGGIYYQVTQNSSSPPATPAPS
jgi:hypothetical protein